MEEALSPSMRGTRWRISAGSIIQNEHPIITRSLRGWDKGQGLSCCKHPDILCGGIAGVEPPGRESCGMEVLWVYHDGFTYRQIDHGIVFTGAEKGFGVFAFGALALREDRRIGNARTMRPGFDESAQVAGLGGAGSRQCIQPAPVGVINGFFSCTHKLPDGMVAIGDAAGAGEDRAIQLFPYIIIPEAAAVGVPFRPGVDGMIFIVRFCVEGGFCGGEGAVVVDVFPTGYVMTGTVTGLEHVDVEPGFVVDPPGGGAAARGMVTNEALVICCVDDAGCHAAPNGTPVIFFVCGRAVAAKDPDDVWIVFVAMGDGIAVFVGIDAIEDHGSVTPGLCDLVAPGGEKADEEAAGLRHFQGTVDEGEISFVWLCRIEVVEGEVAVAVGAAEAVEFGEGYGLDDGEAFCGAVIEIGFYFFEGEAVKEFPTRVAEPEEGGAVGVLEIVAVGGWAEAAMGPRL